MRSGGETQAKFSGHVPCVALCRRDEAYSGAEEEDDMNSIFYIIGVVVVVMAILGYLGLR